MKEKLEIILQDALTELHRVQAEDALQELRVKYLGKKGLLTSVMKELGALPVEDRPAAGQMVNTVKARLEAEVGAMLNRIRLEDKEKKLRNERVDVTLPGRRRPLGTKHPITLVTEEIVDIFAGLGFQVAEGPEIEKDYYNFEALNVPKLANPQSYRISPYR